MGLNILAYFIAGLVVLIVLINILGRIRPSRPLKRKPRPQAPVIVQPVRQATYEGIYKPAQQHPVTLALDANLCKKYPLIDTAYKNGYRFVSYDPLIMELRE